MNFRSRRALLAVGVVTLAATGVTLGVVATSGGHRLGAGVVGGVAVACPTSGGGVVGLTSASNIQTAVNAAAASTVFHLAAGTYSGQSVIPKTGDSFCGDGIGSTILDGGQTGGGCSSAISGNNDSTIDNVTIKNMTARNYCTLGGNGGQATFYSDGVSSITQRGSGWKVVSTEVDNSNIGIKVGDNSYVAGNRLFHNYRYGTGGGGNNSVFEYNTYDQNDWIGRANSIDGDSGANKSAISDNVRFSYNLITNSSEAGIWFDTSNSNCEVDHNFIQHLGDSGMFNEISYGCNIHDNIVENVGLQDNGDAHIGVGLEISTSGTTTAGYGQIVVTHNYFVDDHTGIFVHQENRSPDTSLGNAHGQYCSNNANISGNYILSRPFTDDVTGQTITPVAAGNQNGGTPPGCQSSASNTWAGNHYYLDSTGRAAFQLTGAGSTFAQWQAAGRDTAASGGTVDVAANFPALPTFTTGQAGYLATGAGNSISITNPGSQSAPTGSAVTPLSISATDSGGATMTYAATGLPNGLSENSSTGTITGTPTTTGSSSVTITVTDTTGVSNSVAFTWTVSQGCIGAVKPFVKGAPVVPFKIRLGTTSGLPLTFTQTGLPPGLSINSATGIITGTPTTAGAYTVVITATDTTGATGSATFTWTISATGCTGSTTFGTTTIGGTLDNSGAGFEFGNQYTPSSSGTITDFKTYVSGSAGQYTPALYSVTAGVIGSLVAAGNPITLTTPQAAGWVTDTVAAPGGSVTAGQTYLLGVYTKPTGISGSVQFYYATGGTNYFAPYTAAFPTPAGTWPTGGGSAANTKYSFYVDVN